MGGGSPGRRPRHQGARGSPGDDSGATDVAHSTADVLNVSARAGEPTGKGPLHDAAQAYDRASREPYGRAGPTSLSATDLRLAATTLALVARAGRDDGAALVALTVALAGLLDAVAEFSTGQARGAQAAAAGAEPGRPAEQLHGVGTSWGPVGRQRQLGLPQRWFPCPPASRLRARSSPLGV